MEASPRNTCIADDKSEGGTISDCSRIPSNCEIQVGDTHRSTIDLTSGDENAITGAAEAGTNADEQKQDHDSEKKSEIETAARQAEQKAEQKNDNKKSEIETAARQAE